jgi:hypothetical protein
MSFKSNTIEISLVAAADLSAKQYYFIKIDSAGKAALAGAGEFAIGTLSNKPAAGDIANVAVGGVVKAFSAGTIAAGVVIAADAAGKAKAAVAGATTSSNAIGVTLESSVAGDIVAVLLTHAGGTPTTPT